MFSRRDLLRAVAAAGAGWTLGTPPAFTLDEPLPALEAVFPVKGQRDRVFPIGFGKVATGFCFTIPEIVGDSFTVDRIVVREVGSGRVLASNMLAASHHIGPGMVMKIELGTVDE